MPFEIARSSHSLGKPVVGADALVITTRRGPKGRSYLLFEVGVTLGDDLGFKEGARLEVAWGTGEDRGKLRLRLTDDGAFRLKRGKAGQRLLSFTVSDIPSDFSGKSYKRQKVSNVENLAPAKPGASAFVMVTLPHNFFGRPAGALGYE